MQEENKVSIDAIRAELDGPPKKEPEKVSAPKKRRKKSRDEEGDKSRADIMAYIIDHPGCRQSDITHGLGISKSRVSYTILSFLKQGIISREGESVIGAKLRFFKEIPPYVEVPVYGGVGKKGIVEELPPVKRKYKRRMTKARKEAIMSNLAKGRAVKHKKYLARQKKPSFFQRLMGG